MRAELAERLPHTHHFGEGEAVEGGVGDGGEGFGRPRVIPVDGAARDERGEHAAIRSEYTETKSARQSWGEVEIEGEDKDEGEGKGEGEGESEDQVWG